MRLVGLPPLARESGTWKGRCFIRGGRPRIDRVCNPLREPTSGEEIAATYDPNRQMICREMTGLWFVPCFVETIWADDILYPTGVVGGDAVSHDIPRRRLREYKLKEEVIHEMYRM